MPGWISANCANFKISQRINLSVLWARLPKLQKRGNEFRPIAGSPFDEDVQSSANYTWRCRKFAAKVYTALLSDLEEINRKRYMQKGPVSHLFCINDTGDFTKRAHENAQYLNKKTRRHDRCLEATRLQATDWLGAP